MKRFLYTIAAVLAVTTVSQAQTSGIARLNLTSGSAPAAVPAPAGYPVAEASPVVMGGGCPAGSCDRKFGLHPVLKKLMWWRADCGCQEKPRILGNFGGLMGGNAAGRAILANGGIGTRGAGPFASGLGGAGYGGPGAYGGLGDRIRAANAPGPIPEPGIGYPGTPGAGMPGTLVFPHHQYVRSPRDFFMQDPR
jgi:hypothetical protein